VSAECTVADCDLSAVGRCRHCDRHFCGSHRFVGPSGAAALDLCIDCGLPTAEAEAYTVRDRQTSLATIRAVAKSLVEEGLSPPDAYAWTYRTDSAWWAFGSFGRTRVAVPVKFGWPVGDYPWEGRVNVGRGTSANEVFVRPTYVDAEGQIVPRDATRGTVMNAELFTDEMCREVAETMLEIADAALTAHAAGHTPRP
jgi:hypothetical protein